MAHESFEDKDIAQILNRSFISIKVDREERPDIDAVYMSVCQAVTGSGGWPLTIIMTPDKKPFFAGTYFPKQGRNGSIGLMDLLLFIEKSWKESPERLTAESRNLTDFMKKRQKAASGEALKSPEQLRQEAVSYYRKTFDPKWGGFGPMPKFPSPHNLLFLMEQGGEECMAMAEKTLIQMYRGGIFDHIGGGFCRYSTDDRWLVPHFEKMLYDNAMLFMTYAKAFSLTGDELYKQVARRTADYVAAELTSPEGGFYCSQDADSQGVEGKYYVFLPGEIISALGEAGGWDFCKRFDITKAGNFEGTNIPNRINDPDYRQPEDSKTLKQLQEFRKGRTSLHRDDKILTGWNGLMTAAFAIGGRLLGTPDYVKRAEAAAAFVWQKLHRGKGKLFTRWREGKADFYGTLEDYAFFAWGLLECYRSTFHIDYLEKAIAVGDEMLRQFFDADEGGCFLYSADSEQLFLRPKELYDGAMPSGNAAAALVMKRLAFLTGSEKWRKAWEKQSDYMQSNIRHPAGHSFFLWILACEEGEEGQLICTGNEGSLAEKLAEKNMEILVKTTENQAQAERLAPFLKEYPIPHEGTDFYLCQKGACKAPVHSLKELEKITKNS